MLGKAKARLTKLGVFAVTAAALATGVVPAIRNASADPAPTAADDGVKVSFYDYWANSRPDHEAYEAGKENVNLATGGTKKSDGTVSEQSAKFQFGGDWSYAEYPWNNTSNQDVSDGLVKNNLNGQDFPTFSSKVSKGQTLEYLFSNSDYATAYEGVTGLFGNVTGNHYHFNSRENFAQLDASHEKITLLNEFQHEFPSFNNDNKAVPKFLPFNTLDEMVDGFNNGTDKNGNTGTSAGEIVKGKYYRANYSFGMKVEATFRQPEDGMTTNTNGGKEPMVFEFKGDDDVWVFIDDALVLDLGGLHPEKGGTINFATGEVTVDGKLVTTLQHAFEEAGVTAEFDENGRFADYSNHKLKFFYLERGNGASNCYLDFNLETIPEGTLDIHKKITQSNTADFADTQFKIRVDIARTEAATQPETGYEPFNGTYQIYDKANNPVGEEKKTTDGTFTLKDGQYARLLEFSDGTKIKATDWYKVTELAADGYATDDYDFSLSGATVTAKGDGEVGQSAPVQYGKNPSATVGNNFIAKNKYTVTVDKKMAGNQTVTAGTKFKMYVTANGQPFKGDYQIDGDINKPDKTDDGYIELEAGHSVKFIGLNPSTTLKVEEVELADNYEQPTYKDNDSGANANATDGTVTVNPSNQNGTITVTNKSKTAVLLASIKVRKNLEGRVWKSNESFEFVIADDTADNVTSPLPSPAKVEVRESSEEKIATFGSITYTAPGEYTYIVTETEKSGGDLVYSKAQYKVVVTVAFADGNSAATVTSITKIKDDSGASVDETQADMPMVFTNKLKTSDLSISKTVKGDAANKDEHFKFTLRASNNIAEGISYDINYGNTVSLEDSNEAKLHPIKVTFDASGTPTFTYREGVTGFDANHLQLKHGETATIVGLPVGMQVTVIETDVATATDVKATVTLNEEAKLTKEGNGYKIDTVITADKTNDVAFTNTTNHAPQTGISSNVLPMAGLMATAVIGGSALAMEQRKRAAGKPGSDAWKE